MVTDQKIKIVADKIAKEYKPEKIMLFGSYAWGVPNVDSDVDLCIVKKTKDTRDMARKIDGSLWGRTFPIDIIVYTPSTIKERIKKDFFVKDIFEKGKILYESKLSRMAK
ncbi:nucleotidyltransferase domain-containing protein [bacterium]|nr:MAG: nucleotidyltransferase domain-containing protein [bacterium]